MILPLQVVHWRSFLLHRHEASVYEWVNVIILRFEVLTKRVTMLHRHEKVLHRRVVMLHRYTYLLHNSDDVLHCYMILLHR